MKLQKNFYWIIRKFYLFPIIPHRFQLNVIEKYAKKWGRWRPLLSWLANKYVALVAGIPIRDTTSGYRAYRREVLEETEFDRIKIRGYVVHGEMAYQAWVHGFRLGEVPIHFRKAITSRSGRIAHKIPVAQMRTGGF